MICASNLAYLALKVCLHFSWHFSEISKCTLSIIYFKYTIIRPTGNITECQCYKHTRIVVSKLSRYQTSFWFFNRTSPSFYLWDYQKTESQGTSLRNYNKCFKMLSRKSSHWHVFVYQVIGIPMGTRRVWRYQKVNRLLFPYSYEVEFIQQPIKDKNT